MSLDLGALVGRVVLEDVEFQRTYARVVGQMRGLGMEAGKAASGTTTLDRALTDTGVAAGTAAAGMERAGKAAVSSASADQKAALAASRRAEAVARVTAIMAPLTEATTREQVATLRQAAAQERANIAAGQGSAEFARLASAQASATAATERASAAQIAAMGSTNKWRGAMAGLIKMAGELGLIIGVFAAAKAAVDIGHEAANFQRQMLQIQTVANASASEVDHMSKAVLNMAGDVGTAPDQLAISLYHIEQNGLRGSQALEVLHTAAKGAKIGMADVEATTNSMTSAVASGIEGVQNMDQAMGALLATVGTGDMKMSDLNDALSNGILSVAKTYGLSLHDVGASLAVFGDLNIRGKDAATQLRQAIMAFAKPAVGPAAQDMLDRLGMTTKTLAQDMEHGGLNEAVTDLRGRLIAAGITGDKVGKALLDLFGKKAGIGVSVLVDQYDRLQTKYHELEEGAASFADKWKATQKTAGFQLERLGAEAKSTGIQLATHLLPVGSEVVSLIASGIPHAIDLAGHALAPFGAAWHLVSAGMTPVVHLVGDLLHILAPAAPALQGVAAAALAMWAAFKGYELARAAVFAVMDLSANMAARVTNSYGSIRVAMAGTVSEGELTARIMQAEFAQIEAAAAQSAAAHEQAGARIAAAYADQVAASTAATDAQVANAGELAAAQSAAARSAVQTAAVTTGAAEEAAVAVNTAGATARIGWASIAGPLGLAAVGVLTLITMFRHSTAASKEAAEAAKAYTDALKDDTNGSTILDAIVHRLGDAHLPDKLKEINKGLANLADQSAFTGQEFVAAIKNGGVPLDDLKARLEGVVAMGTKYRYMNGQLLKDGYTAAGQAAKDALSMLDTEHAALTKSQKQEIATYQSLGIVAASVQQVGSALDLTSSQVTKYAGMLGLAVTKNGDLVDATEANQKAILNVAQAFDAASQSGSEFLSALQSFAGSAGTASDRAAIIGATLKAANGDALAYGGAMASAADANRAFSAGVQQAAKDAGKSTKDYLASVVDLKTGTIEYGKAGAGPLIQSLQQIQTAAMQAAGATYQHERAVRGGANAANDAYDLYVGKTRGMFIDQEGHLTATAKQLGLNAQQAAALADQYFGMPKDVKTMIEQEGANPIVDVLNQIGEQLSFLTHHPWTTKVDANTKPAEDKSVALQNRLDLIKQGKIPEIDVSTLAGEAELGNIQRKIDELHGKTLDIHFQYIESSQAAAIASKGKASTPFAAGGSVGDGWFTVGEQGFEVGYKHGNSVQIFPNSVARTMTGWDRVPGYATGTTPPATKDVRGGKTVWIVNDREYASERAAHNAAVAYAKTQSKRDAAALKALATVQREYQFTYLPAFVKALGGTTSALKSAGVTLIAHLAQAKQNHQISSGLLSSVVSENARLDKLAGERDTIAGRLKTANDNLAAAVKERADFANQVASSLASFNLATFTAPQQEAGQAPLTVGSILAQLQAQSAADQTDQQSQLTQSNADMAMTNAQAAVQQLAWLRSVHASTDAIKAAQAYADTTVAAANDAAKKASDAAQLATQAKNAVTAATAGAGGGAGISAVIDGLQAAVDKAKLFGSEMDELRKRGLNDTDRKQLADAMQSNPDQTMQRLQDLLAATPDQIKQINVLTAQLGTTSQIVGKQIAGGLYDAGVEAARGLVKGLQSQENTIARQMKALGDAMVQSIKDELKIHSPSQVTRELGQFTGKGYALGLDDTRRVVAVSSKSLTNFAAPKLQGVSGPVTAMVEPAWARGLRDELVAVRAEIAASSDRNAALVTEGVHGSLTAVQARQERFARQGRAR